MGKASYKKFLKKERAKVKLKTKSDKTLLPKGQNVTDLNYKVKKIVIQSQLKEHDENEVLSTRKLNIQEVLSRLNHYSGSVATEAVGELDSIIKSGGTNILINHLHPVVSQLSKLLTSSYSHLRKAAIKMLSSIFTKIDESKWSVIEGIIIGYIVCGLSNVDADIRLDTLLILDSVPHSSLAMSVPSLLPSLLDVLSTSHSSSGGFGRTLSTHITSSPVAHRASVLSRIRSVLSSLQTNSISKYNVNDDTSVIWKEGSSMRVPVRPFYPQDNYLSLSEFTSTAKVDQQVDLKDFASSLVPLMMDSFVEIAPEPDDNEPVSYLNRDGMKLLDSVADIMLLFQNLISSNDPSHKNWMKDKFGLTFYKRIIENRFPYSEDMSKKQKGRSNKDNVQISCLKVNLTLSLLCLCFTHTSQWTPIFQYLCEILRYNKEIEENELLEKCLSTYLSCNSEKTCNRLLSSLASVKRSSPFFKEVFSVLSKLHISQNNDNIYLNSWINQLLADLSSKDEPLHCDSLEFLKLVAPMSNLGDNLNVSFSSILEKSMQLEDSVLLEVSHLLYWMTDCDNYSLNLLEQLIENHSCDKSIKSHFINLLKYKCERYPDAEISKKLISHSYWSEIIN